MRRAVVACLLLVLFASAPAGAGPVIPQDAYKYRSILIRSARAVWGLDAPTATLAAQVHQESYWRANAVSHVGARGLTQFMPATSKWIAGLYPELSANAPNSPAWALQAQARYMYWLWVRVRAVDPCQRMAKALSSYNGGLGWLQRDERLAAQRGLDPAIWWGGVETVNSGRSRAAKTENQQYPHKILLTLEPLYERAGWGLGVCHD